MESGTGSGSPFSLIEHDMSLVMEVCERLYVLDYGTPHRHRHPG